MVTTHAVLTKKRHRRSHVERSIPVIAPTLLPTLANCFRGPVLRDLLFKGHSAYLQSALADSGLATSMEAGTTLSEALFAVFSHLRRVYRSDYVYRAAVVSKLFLGRHSPDTTTLLSELRVDNCRADLVMFNGTSSVYEIKTANDSTSRLPSQLAAYASMFDKIFILADEKHIDTIRSIASECVGILELTPQFTIRTIRQPIENSKNVVPSVIFDTFRKEEWLEATNVIFGKVPDAKPIDLCDACREMFVKAEPRLAHEVMVRVLKKRKQLKKSDFEIVPEFLTAAFVESAVAPERLAPTPIRLGHNHRHKNAVEMKGPQEMYFPYFRGRQEELLAINEAAPNLAANGKIIPVIEPVRTNAPAVVRCAQTCASNGVRLGLVMNPAVGHLTNNHGYVQADILAGVQNAGCGVTPFYLIHGATTASEIRQFLSTYSSGDVGFVHFGEPTGTSAVLNVLKSGQARSIHLMIDGACGPHYKASVTGIIRGLIRDGFRRQNRNADYTAVREFFTDLHSTYSGLGFNGFGDFLTVGIDYLEGGGAPRAIALHLTSDDNGSVYCHHFVSTSNATAANRDRKYREALDALYAFERRNQKLFHYSSAVKEFLADRAAGSPTSLGKMKRRSMKHHLELMCTLV